MSVEINPHSQLGFPRPLTQVVKKTLTVSNPNPQPVAFKVKTTAPKQYCVRPNSGRIEPGEKVDIQVLLQPLKEEPPVNAKCRDKFLVQSAVITADKETLSVPDLWSVLERDAKSSIAEHKIRCAFLPPNSAPLAEETEGLDAASAVPASAAGVGAGAFASQSTRGGAQPPIAIANVQGTGATVAGQPAVTPVAAEQQQWARQAAPVTTTSSAVAPAKSSGGVPVHIVAAIADHSRVGAGLGLYEWISRRLTDEKTWNLAKAKHATIIAEFRKRLNI
ncbi:phosphatidylinositol-binding protein scs2 [Malassezia cuniculi]|uniref:Phosphatidylinositol-binding protein scs2 n=1 Tax=Malassezia cuniculi TaxID=948313 RepID=A0AAF0ET12_9BASI|nr:phosphatidylinositol-binding protein scs2 [Malassezia cuniculi]